MLTDAGYFAEAVSNLASALETLNRRFFHVAIVDLELGGSAEHRDGLAVLRRIWELDETLVIVSSDCADASMFDVFRRIGIFSTESLAQARRGFQSIAFYKGHIRKDEPLDSILAKVKQAAAEARSTSTRRQWNTSPFNILKGISSREVQRALRVGLMTELRPFLGALVQPLFPWLQSKIPAAAICDEHETLAFETLCWSRAQAQALLVRFGRRDSFDKAMDITAVGSIHNVAALAEKENQAHLSSDHFEGIIRRVPQLDLHQHFGLPPLKRGIGE